MATDHESLSGLKGKGPKHYHLTREQWEKLRALLEDGPPPVITAGQTLRLIAGMAMTAYAVRGENTSLT